MSTVQINPNKVYHEGSKRKGFRMIVMIHALVFVLSNMLIWLLWLAIPHDANAFPVPIVITGGWLVVLVAHAIIVLVSHTPSEVQRDEIKRQMQQ